MLSRDNRKAGRISLKDPLKVTMGSIGSDVRYHLETKDISYSGFFLDFEKPGRFPFTPASIMEVWLELSPNLTVFFNGKMARVVYPQQEEDSQEDIQGPGIAIRIVQIDAKQDAELRAFIDQFSEDS